ncbi:SMI1/KNR4 family protein [Streptomyces sp. NPDC002577]
MAALEDIKALLGEPRNGTFDPEAWSRLENELGIEFPRDFREFCDAYGPVRINNQVVTKHPGVARANLGQLIRSDIEAWPHAPEEMVIHPVGTGPGELFPWGTSASGETMFFRVPKGASEPWSIFVYWSDEGEFAEYAMSFSDWMLAYLRGEDVGVCSRNFAPEGPFFQQLD